VQYATPPRPFIDIVYSAGSRASAFPAAKIKTDPAHTIKMHHRKKITTLLLALLSGCTTLGTPYSSPHDGEPAATIEVTGGPVYLVQTNDKGCYVGKTRIDNAPGAPPVKVRPGATVLLEYDGTCLITFGFVPLKDARYWVSTSEEDVLSDPKPSFLNVLGPTRMRRCSVALDDVSAGENAARPIKVTQFHPHQTGLACIKLSEEKPTLLPFR
jgi:hypothetical protein